MISTPNQQVVDDVIISRRSIRAFLPLPVNVDDIRKILDISARAPSGSNTQPWKVYVLTGNKLRQLSEHILAAHNELESAKVHQEEYNYYMLCLDSAEKIKVACMLSMVEIMRFLMRQLA